MWEGPNAKLEKVEITKVLKLVPDFNTTDASAISVETPTTFVDTGAAETRTLANAGEGTEKKIIAKSTMTGACVITPTSLANGTTITLTAAGDGWYGVFHAGEWHTINLYGTAAIA